MPEYYPGMDPAMGGPGMAPPAPGWMGMTPGALGFGHQSGQMVSGMQSAQMQGGMAFGGAAINAAGTAGSYGYQALNLGSMTIAPLMAQHGSSAVVRGLGTGMRAIADPFYYGEMGWKFGKGIATGARMGAAGGVGMGLVAGAAATGGAMIAMEAPAQIIEHLYAGTRAAMRGQAMIAQVNPSNIGNSVGSKGMSGFGQEVEKLAKGMGTTGEELQDLSRTMDQMKMFQSTRSVAEYRAKFKEVLSAVKEVSKTLQTTLEESLQVIGGLRGQGFYSSADVTAQAAKLKAREATSGVSVAEQLGYGQFGSQQARAYGMRGKFGSEFVQRNVTHMASAYKDMSPEMQERIEEMGGSEQVALSMSARQMRFLSSSRGRAMIAATMGQGGGPSMNSLGGMLGGGMTTEGIVEGAAGRGLGTLMASGGPRAKEQYMQYADMMMITMAMSQSRQLYGGVSERGTIGMLGTMGVGRDEARVMLAQAMARPKEIAREAAETQYQSQKAEYEVLKKQESITGSMGRKWDRVWEGTEASAGRAYERAGDTYSNTANNLAGYHEYTVTDSERAAGRRSVSRGDKPPGAFDRSTGGSMFGPRSAQERALDSFGRFASGDKISDPNLRLIEDTLASPTNTLTSKQQARLSVAGKQGYFEGSAVDFLFGTGMGIARQNSAWYNGNGAGLDATDKAVKQSAPGGFDQDMAMHMGVGTGGKGLSKSETAAYEILHESGYITIGKEAYAKELRKPSGEVRSIQDQKTAASALARDGKSKQEILALGLDQTMLSGAVLTEEAASADLKFLLEKTRSNSGWTGKVAYVAASIITGLGVPVMDAVGYALSGETIGWDFIDGLMGNEKALSEELQKGGGLMKDFQTLVDATVNGDDPEAVDAALKKIKDSSPTAYQAAVAISKDKKRAKEWQDGLGKGGILESSDAKARAAIVSTMYGKEVGARQARHGKADKHGVNSKAFYEQLQKGGKDRSTAYGDAILSLIRDGEGGKITAEEMKHLEDLSGGTGKTLGITGAIEAFGTDRKSDKRIMEKYELTEQELALARGDKEGSRAGLTRLLTKKNYTDAAFNGSVDETTVEGITTKYVEANTAFVTAVSIFTHALAASNIGKLAGLGDVAVNLGDAANGVPGVGGP